MKDDNVILEMSYEDAERLDDLLFGLMPIRTGSVETIDSMCVKAHIVLNKNCFDSYKDLRDWIYKMNDLVYQAKIKYIADRTDPILP